MKKESEKNLIEAIKLMMYTSDAVHEYKYDPDTVRNIVHNHMVYLATKFIKIAFYENKPEIIDLITSKYGGKGRIITELELGITREIPYDGYNEYGVPTVEKLFVKGKKIDSETYRRIVREHEDKKRKANKKISDLM